jgi:hypothetical protein
LSAEKLDTFAERLPSFGDQVRDKLPCMRDHGPDFQIDANARGASAFGEPRGIIQQDFVRAHVNEERRQAG